MILIGLDDTDVADSRGTNQLAKRIARELSADWRCLRIVRHQLLDDPRVPYTSKNGSASIAVVSRYEESSDGMEHDPAAAKGLLDRCRAIMRGDFIEGSDPGLCLLAGPCPPEIVEWGLRCQREVVTPAEAYGLAKQSGVHLESLGGTEDGVIGALAAVGLASTLNDGRIVQWGEWPDDLTGRHTVGTLTDRGVLVRELSTSRDVTVGEIEIRKRLRPNLRQGQAVLFVETLQSGTYRDLKLN